MIIRAGVTGGLIGLNQNVTWKARHFGLPLTLTSRVTEFDPPHRFVEEQIHGPCSMRRLHDQRLIP